MPNQAILCTHVRPPRDYQLSLRAYTRSLNCLHLNCAVAMMANPAYSVAYTLNRQSSPGDDGRSAYEDHVQASCESYAVPRSSEQVEEYDHLRHNGAEAQVAILDTGSTELYSSLSSSMQYKVISICYICNSVETHCYVPSQISGSFRARFT